MVLESDIVQFVVDYAAVDHVLGDESRLCRLTEVHVTVLGVKDDMMVRRAPLFDLVERV
jgi:hypothetical protein